ncbi:polycomb group protein EMF2B [Cryptomeria japonica]|uniref:polycomb group protein EMF2B n=1 Tax=Cryptomeria japonica TaxID=3369 RepID=UPI0025AC665B|nr:polycomb group protein EMF2B [Cryptomeria japonica]
MRNHTRNRNISRSADQMYYQESQMYNFSPEEKYAVEESLATYCKPVEFYNILQRRALRHPLFLQRCLRYKIQAKRRKRIKMTITFSGFVRNEVQEQNVFPLYVLVSSPISDSLGDSAVFRSGRTCLLKASTRQGCNEQSAVSFILPEIGKLSEDVVTDNLTILLVYCVDNRSLHGEKNLQIPSLVNYSGEVLWGKLAMGSLCNSWESSVRLKLGHKADVISSVDLHSSILEHTRQENGVDHLIFKAPSNSDDLNSLMRLQVDISAQELGPRESSPYDSYSYSDIPTSLLPRIVRMRAGNVVFNYKYYNNKLRKTEVTEDFTCPFCLVHCSSFQGLRHHLTCSHDLFNFAFWVNEEFQTVDVSLKTEIWRYEGNIADEDGNVAPFKAFSYCSKSCSVKRRRTAVRDSAYSHLQVKQDSLGTGSFGQSQNALIKTAPANSHEASVGPFINGTISSKEPSSARAVYNQLPGRTLSEIQNSTELEPGSHLAPSSPAREDRPQINDALRVESKEDTEKHGIIGNGEIALPSQRHEIENACMEQACAGESMLAGIQVSVADSGEYGPQTDASNLIPPSTLRFGKTRKLSVEGGEPRCRILLKKRQFFHSHRAQPMALEQVFSDRDSEDEVDDDIADFEDRRMLDDFVDVTKYEKQLMHLWNSFVRKQRVLADGHVPWACEAFSKHHGQDLARFPPLRWCWRLFMVKLWNHNLLDASIMNRCNNIIDDFGKNQ